MSDLINNPDASRLIYGLRDTGYNVRTAVADVIDNSIAANATVVNVEIELRPDGRKFVYIGDDGDGMDGAGVYNAMRYGAPARKNAKSLGKFGLGLKTASSSVCRKFTVISRKSADQLLGKLAWDLEHVAQRNTWEMLREPVTDEERGLFEEYCGAKGTLVIWSSCDRILSKEYTEPGGTQEKQAIKRLAESLAEHVSLIYHRFLDAADNRERNITIRINGLPVEPWNPFYPTKSEQILGDGQQSVPMRTADGRVERAGIRAWILPHRRDMSREEHDRFARITNKAQGFYIYREGRLIQDGGWIGVFSAPEPHTSLLRIEFDFGHELDEAFKVDVKKSRILLDPALEEHLRKLLQPIYREAGLRYRRKNREIVVGKGIDHASANHSIKGTPGTTKPQVTAVDAATQSAVVGNNRGPSIRIRQPVQDNVRPESVHVEAVETITSGQLWQPALRSLGTTGHVTGVLLNKHHDFYQKIYQRAAASGYAVEGMDLLLWAFAAAEQNNTNAELEPIFEDIRDEISSNLRKLLRQLEDPQPEELEEGEETGDDRS
jgi:hypothetical protein